MMILKLQQKRGVLTCNATLESNYFGDIYLSLSYCIKMRC